MSTCYECKEDVSKEGDYVTCYACGSNYHFDCCGLSSRTWKAKSHKKKTEWKCVACRENVRLDSIGSADEEEITDPNLLILKSIIEKLFKKHENIMNEKVQSMSDIVQKMESKMSSLVNKIKEVEQNTITLRAEINELRTNIEAEKQYTRSKNIKVIGMPSTGNDNTRKEILRLLNALKIDVNEAQLTIHRVQSKTDNSPVIIQCPNKAVRDEIVRKARKERPNLSLINTDLQDRPIYFNDHLTPYYANLMMEARKLKTSLKYKYLWMNGEKIFLKKDENSKIIKIMKIEDLQNVIRE
jgi:hypothetical protein